MKENEKEVKQYLEKHCDLSIVQACSLNLNILTLIEKDNRANDGYKINENTEGECEKLRRANLIKDNYLITPLINYSYGIDKIKNLVTLNLRCSKDHINNSQSHICKNSKKCELKLDLNRFKYAPRFIHYHEVQHYNFFIEAYRYESGYFGSYVKNAKDFYSDAGINGLNLSKKSEPSFDEDLDIPKYLNMRVNEITIPAIAERESLRIGVTSIKVDNKNISQSYLKTPNLSRDRFNKLIKLINYIELTKSDVVVFPEVSVPFAWIGILTIFARKQQKTIIFGLEHMINRNNVAMNFLATVVPYKIGGYNYSYLKIRLKNHYSPDEVRQLKGYRYKIPYNVEMSYDLFKWKGVRFSCFNCFELADIQHRSYFRSKVDFLTASEYNRDIPYFSNIVESVARDVHCYFIQSNSSDFGDSRITRPSRTYEKDIVKLKGGINDQVVVGEINIKQLREFQYKEYELQKDDQSFKPTPPNFDKKEIEKVLSES
ncbi:hypothetical protein [Isachenkonia alkalipeptolytica]|uniref:Uncharacterized protein n=1 Tax=Isachenkonia alkalipeptolytica TaxID=2565777 RepID=A0AA43XLQ8_9CLOT|nr:hypothetical protein [Isachenkonia alkalipeptolytica]NBG88641.1 hypothetical protein [Isachenkonia alkalipeptolytica]